MRITHLIFAAVIALGPPATLAPASAQGMKHSIFMRGHIVSMSDGTATVCVGKADGATPGQLLDVVRVVPVAAPPGKSVSGFARRDIGHVRIESVFDEHFARASVVSGSPQVHDIVELGRN